MMNMDPENNVLAQRMSPTLLLSASHDPLLKCWNAERSKGRQENHISHFIILCEVVFAVNCQTKTSLPCSSMWELFEALHLSPVTPSLVFLLLSPSSLFPLTVPSVSFYKRKTMPVRQGSSEQPDRSSLGEAGGRGGSIFSLYLHMKNLRKQFLTRAQMHYSLSHFTLLKTLYELYD